MQDQQPYEGTPLYIPTDQDTGLPDIQAAELLGLSVHTLRAYRQQEPPYQCSKFRRLNCRVIYLRKDVLTYRERYGIPAVMMDELSWCNSNPAPEAAGLGRRAVSGWIDEINSGIQSQCKRCDSKAGKA